MDSVGDKSSPHFPIDSGGKAKSERPVTAVVLSPQSLQSWNKLIIFKDQEIFQEIFNIRYKIKVGYNITIATLIWQFVNPKLVTLTDFENYAVTFQN